MKIIITGGAGFMGSNMVHYILDNYPEYKLLNFDKLTYAANLNNLDGVAQNPNYQFVEGDIADTSSVEEVIERFQPDVILNYAAETHVDRSILEPRIFLETQIIGTHTLLEAVRKHKVPRFVQISTDEVFGDILEGKFTEDSPFEPNSPYSASKAGADHLCRAYHKTFGTPAIVTHSCNVYGSYQFPDKLISRSVTNLIEDKPMYLNGDGSNIREWIYVEDHCRAIDAVMHKGKVGEAYNIGTGEERTNLEVMELLLKIFDKDDSQIVRVKDRPANDRRYAIDNTKLRTELDWEPKYNFEDGMEKTVEWFKAHEAWWKPLKNSEEHIGFFKKLYMSDNE